MQGIAGTQSPPGLNTIRSPSREDTTAVLMRDASLGSMTPACADDLISESVTPACADDGRTRVAQSTMSSRISLGSVPRHRSSNPSPSLATSDS
eukprot:7295186-Lingulodinium_polyedra.AAC.1